MKSHRQIAVTRAVMARRAKAAQTARETTVILPGDSVEVTIDLQSATMTHGVTRRGKAFATFKERGLPVVMGFGRVADQLVAQRYARGVAQQDGGVLRVVAIQSPNGLVDESGRACVRAAA